MANIKFSGFTAVTDIAAITEIVGYNGTQNVRISPANFLNSGGPFLPLTGGTMVGDVTFNDNEQLVLGTSGNFNMFFDGSDTTLQNFSGNLNIVNKANDKDIIFASDNGSGGTATYMYLDGSIGETRFEKPTRHDDGIVAKFGNGNDLNIYHDGSNSYIQDIGTGGLNITGSRIQLIDTGGKSWIDTNGLQVELKYDNSTKLKTTSTGIEITGNLDSPSISINDYIVHNGDDNTFFGFPSADTISFTTAGAERMRIDSVGNVGIGITNPDQKLTVNGSIKCLGGGSYAAGVTFASELQLANNITILNKAQTTYIPFATRDTSGSEVVMDLTNVSINGGAVGPYLPLAGGTLTGNTTNTPGTEVRFGNSNELGIFNSSGVSNIRVNSGYLAIRADDMRFMNQDTTEKMRITSDGRVGIGTTTPVEQLTVFGQVASTSSNSTSSTAGANRAIMDLSGGGARMGHFRGATAAGSGFLRLFTDSVERMRIDSAGNVGIGTSSPYTNLEIEGSGADSIVRLYAGGGTANIRTWEMRAVGVAGEGLLFRQVNDANSVYTNRMIIDTSGNVGIGTVSPTSRLVVKGTDVGVTDNIVVQNSTGTKTFSVSNNGQVNIDGSQKIVTSDASIELRNNGTGLMSLKSASNYGITFGDNGGETMRINTSTNNVGIGTTAPGAKLTVYTSASSDTVGTGTIRLGVGSTEYWNFRQAATSEGDLTIDRTYSGANYEVMRIQRSTGNVGIGTAAPISLSSNTQSLTINSARTDLTGGMYLSANGTNKFQSYWDSQGHINVTIAGDDRFFLGGSERMRITSAGNLLIGTTGTPNGTSVYGSAFIDGGSGLRQLFQASSTTTAVSVQRFYNPNGNVGSVSTSGSATSFNTSSDYRLKEDLQDFAGLDMVSKIPVYDFKWKTDESRSYGVMAHELKKVLPQAVSGDKDAKEMQSVDYSKIVPLLVKSIQELKAEIELLKK